MIVYILKSSLSLIILYGLYWFLLRKEKLFEFNRFFLVLSVVFSLLVPFISIPVNFKTTPGLENFFPVQDYIIQGISTPDNTVASDVNISQPSVENGTSVINISVILLALYISGVILFLIRFLRNIYIIIRWTKSSEKISFKGYRIILTNDKTDPCCFFSSIYLNRDDYLNGRIDKELLDHELEHAKQSHTIDILLIELVKIFYWFNPVHILYDRAIRINHEYLADDGVIGDKSDIENYAAVLLSFITGRRNISLTSGSNHSFTKMRLMMMMKPGSGSFIYGARIAMTLFVGTALFLLLSFKESDEQPSPSNLTETGAVVQQNIVSGIVFNEHGKPFTGVFVESTGTAGNVRAATTGQDGRFSINNVKEDALLLFNFKEYKQVALKPDYNSDMIVKMEIDPDYPKPKLVVFNGVITDESPYVLISNLDGNLGSIRNLTGSEATDKYGEKGKDGVIEITSKALQQPKYPQNMVDFSGKWVFNRLKSKSFLTEVASSTIIILLDKNSITMDITITPDKNKPVNRTEKYVYNESVVKKNTQGDKSTVITCTPSLDGQSFSITETLSYTQNGIEKVTKRVSVYSLGKDGKTLIINQDDTLPEGSLTPEDERHETRVYDKSI